MIYNHTTDFVLKAKNGLSVFRKRIISIPHSALDEEEDTEGKNFQKISEAETRELFSLRAAALMH